MPSHTSHGSGISALGLCIRKALGFTRQRWFHNGRVTSPLTQRYFRSIIQSSFVADCRMSSILIVEDEVLAFRRQATKRSQPAVRKKHKLMLDRESTESRRRALGYSRQARFKWTTDRRGPGAEAHG